MKILGDGFNFYCFLSLSFSLFLNYHQQLIDLDNGPFIEQTSQQFSTLHYIVENEIDLFISVFHPATIIFLFSPKFPSCCRWSSHPGSHDGQCRQPASHQSTVNIFWSSPDNIFFHQWPRGQRGMIYINCCFLKIHSDLKSQNRKILILIYKMFVKLGLLCLKQKMCFLWN